QAGRYRTVFSSWGGAPAEWSLLNPQFKEQLRRDGERRLEPVNLVRTRSPNLPLSITFPNSEFNLPQDAPFTAQPSGPNELVYTWDDPRVHIEKRYAFVPGSYEMQFTVTVENRGGQPLAEHLQMALYGWQDPSIKSGGLLSARSIQTEGQCHVNGKLKHGDL